MEGRGGDPESVACWGGEAGSTDDSHSIDCGGALICGGEEVRSVVGWLMTGAGVSSAGISGAGMSSSDETFHNLRFGFG